MYGKLITYKQLNQTIEVQFECETISIDIISSTIVRVYTQKNNVCCFSSSFEKQQNIISPISVKQQEHDLWISTRDVNIHIFEDGKIDFCDGNDQVICKDYRDDRKSNDVLSEETLRFISMEGHNVTGGNANKYPVEIVKELANVRAIYGLGDKTGFLNKLGYEYEMWNTDNPNPQVESFKALYKSIPFFIALCNNGLYGIYFNNSYHSYFNMGKESEKYYYVGADDGNLDYFYISGATMTAILTQYTWLTGTTPLPQMFTLGYQQSRWGYDSEEVVSEIAHQLRKNEIPCDAIHLDIDYMDSCKVFTWSPTHFKHHKQMIDNLSKQGFKLVTIIDPGVKMEEGYPVYEEGKKNHYFVTTKEGNLYHNVVWPGDSVYPDFGQERVRKWWGRHVQMLLKQGVRGIWNDMNEPAGFQGELPDDLVFSNEGQKTTHKEMHNVYGHNMAKATFEGMKAYDNRRPYIITRACFAGTQSYSSVWTGDNHSIWPHLQMTIPQQCNLGLSGMAFVGTDIGGFCSDATKELMARWIEVGCFSPLFRNHSEKSTRVQEPWQFDKELLDIYRKYVNLRYHWIPYYYDLFFTGEKNGLPIIRPLVLHYTEEEETYELNDEFLVGEQILVAPIVYQGKTKRLVYLPEGIWYDYATGEKIKGKRYIVYHAPLDTCPIFIKEGSILPCYPSQEYIGEKKIMQLILEVQEGEGTYMHYVDDGESYDYRDGLYNSYRFHINKEHEFTIERVHHQYEDQYQSFLVRYCGREYIIPNQGEKMHKILV